MRKISMADVARMAKVSKNTVSLALRNDPQIPRATRDKISEIAERLGYRKNPTVCHLMSVLRAGAKSGHKATLGLLNANQDKNAFRTHPTIPTYVTGCRSRAERLGYGLDEFWLHDPRLDAEKLLRVFRTRNIQGAIITGMMNGNRLPERFQSVWENLPCVVTGLRTREPALSFSCADHHILALRAFQKAIELGYRKPALVLEKSIDELVEGRFSGGMLIAQQALPARRRLAPFFAVSEALANPRIFHEWFQHEKPDVILTLYHVVERWLTDKGIKVPDDVGLIQLEWRNDHSHWAGMHQHNDEVGAAAVEMVIAMIHSGERGVPSVSRATVIGSTWVDGKTVRKNP